MEERVVVEGDKVICRMGTVPSIIMVKRNDLLFVDGRKVILDNELGNVFMVGGFGLCKVVPSSPKPCTAMVIAWEGMPVNFSVMNLSKPLTNICKGTCALGGKGCISFL